MDLKEFRTPHDALVYVDNRLKEQKKQESRQKFVNDQIIIHNRRKNDVCIPIPLGHDQELWFSKLESNGIFKKVFEFVTHPSDVTSAYFTCEMFRKQLEEKRKMMMLPKVFEILWQSLHLNYYGFKFWMLGECRNKSEKDKAKSRDILNQRLVSKSWKELVETKLLVPSTQSEKSSWTFTTEPRSFCVTHPMTSVFKRTEDVIKAIQALHNSTTCAALLRSIEVNDDHFDADGNFYSNLLQLLDTHGKSVWYFRFYYNYHRTRNPQEFNYENLCNLVARMPNLKSLCLTLRDLRQPTAASEAIIDRFREPAELEPFPCISTLEYFRCEWTHVQYEFLIPKILSKNLHLKAVALNNWVRHSQRPDISQVVWDGMRNLHLEYFHIVSFWEPSDTFFQLKRFDWPLKFLHVEQFNKDSLNAYDLFDVLNHYNDTLVEVSVVSRDLEGLLDERCVSVHLPNLKSIYISPFHREGIVDIPYRDACES